MFIRWACNLICGLELCFVTSYVCYCLCLPLSLKPNTASYMNLSEFRSTMKSCQTRHEQSPEAPLDLHLKRKTLVSAYMPNSKLLRRKGQTLILLLFFLNLVYAHVSFMFICVCLNFRSFMPHNLLNVSLFLLKDFKIKEPHNLLKVSLFLFKDFKIKELIQSVI